MKKVVLSGILVGVVIVVCEVLASVALTVLQSQTGIQDLDQRKQASLQTWQDQGVFVPAAVNTQDIVRQPVMHPYTGFTVAELKKIPACESPELASCTERIHGAVDQPFILPDENTAVVAILGGSFADGVARGTGADYLAHFMQYVPAFEGKKVVAYNLAMGTYKQPQQLMQLAYYLALGARFDVVINLDGFNEVAGSLYGWRDSGLHPVYPKSWNFRTASSLNRERLAVYAQKFDLQEDRANFAKFASLPIVRASAIVNVVWLIFDQRAALKLVEIESALADNASIDFSDPRLRGLALESLGPHAEFASLDETANYIGQLWRNGSLSLRDLAEGSGARYYHFLQPNQYIENSKPLSAEELRIAIRKKGGYGNAYRQYRDVLINEAQTLSQQGVHFHDLTYMFQKVPDTLYVDNCCHLNPKGYTLVAQELMLKVKDDWYDLRAVRR